MAVQAKPLFARYADTELIGAGVAGEVYRARDSLLGRVVAVRVLARRFNDDPTVRRRFIRETLAVAPLSAHPRIVTLYDVGDWEGQAYAVTDYLPGGSLEDRLETGPQPPDQVLVWIDQAAAALDAAHERGIAHGRVKPANLLLDAEGDLHVADFGTADALPLAHGSPADDRHALGAVAFELLTGRRPTQTGRISAANRSLPRKLDAVFATALAEDPTERYGSCAEFAAALRAAFAKTAPTAALLWSLAALLALAALGAGIWAGLFDRGTHSAAPPSRRAHSTAVPRPRVHPAVRSTRITPAGEIGKTIQVTVRNCRSGSLHFTLAAQRGPAHVDVSFGRLKSADVLVRGHATQVWIPVQRGTGDDTTCVFYVSPRGAVRSSRITFDRGATSIPAGVPFHRLRAGVTDVATKSTVVPSRTPASSTYGIQAGYCLKGQFLQLDFNQARSDPRYRGATFAKFVAGQGLTCAQPPPGYVRRGFATSNLGVPPGIYPYYSAP